MTLHRRNTRWMPVLTISGLMAAGGVGTALAQETEKDMKGHMSKMEKSMKGQMSGSMMEKCESMMSAHRQMIAEMKAGGEKLDAVVAAMNAAEGDAKIQATADAVSELVTQHGGMTSRMMSMQPKMMRHMMEHMKMSMTEGGEDAMACPMMKEMAGDESDHDHH